MSEKNEEEFLDEPMRWWNIAEVYPRWAEEMEQEVSKEMGLRISVEIDEEWGNQVRFTVHCILAALKKIPEPKGGKRGPKPMSNLHTMQAWVIAGLCRLRRPDLPMQSKNESILSLLASETLTFDGAKICWSAENWKRVLKNADKMISANRKLKNATSLIRLHIFIEKQAYIRNRPDYKTYMSNKIKEYVRYSRQKYAKSITNGARHK